MNDLLYNPDLEFLRPLTTGWISKLEAAHRYRKQWKEVADEVLMYFNKSAVAMWDPKYTKKFWTGGVKAPKFRITINKPFEFVAVFGPNLFWEVPHRTVEAKRGPLIQEDLIPQDQMSQMMYQQLAGPQSQSEQTHLLAAHLMQTWLNYTPGEQPGGGLAGHTELCNLDAMLKGRGVLAPRPYKMPGSGRQLTGCFREDPYNIFFDPDFNSVDDCKWMAIKHVDPWWVVEKKFKLPKNSLKNRASLESSWHQSEINTGDQGNMHRAAGITNDLVVWYEVFSKTGPGARMTGMPDVVKDHLEKVVGDYAYICVSANVPYPLNCPREAFLKNGPNNRGATDDEVKERFSWPIPFWADDRWPIELLDFYQDTESSYPLPPLGAAMGELKFLNFMVPWLCNRIYTSSRDFWAVAAPHIDEFRAYLEEGRDQTILPVPHSVDVDKAISVLQQPETRLDAWRIVEMVSDLFDKRVGLTETAYGRNEGGTQNRTAEETAQKARAVGVRPEHMQKKVVEHQSRLASAEGLVTRWFVQGKDVAAKMGPVGAWLWDKYIVSTDVELIVRQMEYTIAASSIRRPNRDRDISNFQQVMQFFAPAQQDYGQSTGNFEPFNALMQKWGDLHDMDMSQMMMPPPPPPQPDPQAELDMQLAQMDIQGKEIDLQGKQVQAQTRMMDAQAKMAEMQLSMEVQQTKASSDMQSAMAKLQADLAKSEMSLTQDARAARQELLQDAAKHSFDMTADADKHDQEMQQMVEMGRVKIQQAKAQAKAKPKPTSSGTKK